MARKRRRRVRIDRIIMLVLMAAALITVLVFDIKALIGLFDDDGKKDDTPVPAKEGISIEVGDYKVYTDDKDELGFNFVVAELSFRSKDPVNYDLANLMTDEGFKLNDIFAYQKKLDINSYDFSALKTTADIVSDKNEYRCNVFIPYINERDILTLTDGVSGKTFMIDLSKQHADIMDIKYSSTPSEIKTARSERAHV